MTEEKIAVLTDSASDVPAELAAELGIHVLPLLINYEGGECYQDRVTIQPEDIFARMPDEIPSTSTPTPQTVTEVLDRLVDEGVTKVVACTITSGISSTLDLIHSVSQGYPQLEAFCPDTHSLALGSGMVAIAAARMVRGGMSFAELKEELPRVIDATQAFFTVESLTYLYKGGRLSGAGYALGSVLNVRPVVTHDDKGNLNAVAKAKGRKQSLKKMLKLAKAELEGFERYNVAVVNCFADDEAAEFLELVKQELPGYVDLHQGQIGPVLMTHGGPGLIGIAVQGIR